MVFSVVVFVRLLSRVSSISNGRGQERDAGPIHHLSSIHSFFSLNAGQFGQGSDEEGTRALQESILRTLHPRRLVNESVSALIVIL